MERTEYNVTLDLLQSYARTVITVKQGDTHRRLRIRLTQGGVAYSLSPDCYGVFTAQKPDGTVIYNSCETEGNFLIYDLTPQTTATAGVLECEIKLYGPEDALLTAATFRIAVEDTVYSQGEEAVTSTGEATALTQLITASRESLAEMNALLENKEHYATMDDTAVGEKAWSAKNIVDRLCPAFTEGGDVVTCHPAEGYPLEVVSYLDDMIGGPYNSATLHQCGKNLSRNVLRYNTYGGIRVEVQDNILTFHGTATSNCGFDNYSEKLSFYLPAGTYTWSMKHLGGTCSGASLTIGFKDATYWKASYSHNSIPNFAKKFTLAEPTKLCFCALGSGTYDNYRFSIQLEAGEIGTDYEPYRGQTYTSPTFPEPISMGAYYWKNGIVVNDGGRSWWYNPDTQQWEDIGFEGEYDPKDYVGHIKVPALSGTNTLHSDTGYTTVTGRKDPIKVIEDLTNAIVALGGNV